MRRLALFVVTIASAAACATDPQYVPAPTGIEVGAGPMAPDTATATLILPIKPETMADQRDRAAEEARLGLPLTYVQVGDLDVSIEWSIKNLDDRDGTARIQINGGNELFFYVPINFVVDPEEDEEPPPLAGDIPIIVKANGSVGGVFREDQLREASIDLDAITRGAVNPFAAVLTINEADPGVTIGATLVPLDALAQMVRFDITLEAQGHMILEYGLRIRDHRDILHRELLSAPLAELVTFAPAEFVPPPPPE